MLTCPGCGGLTPRDTSSTCLHCDAPLGAPRWARTLTRLLGPAGAILLAACYGAPGRYYTRGQPPANDADHDGATAKPACTIAADQGCWPVAPANASWLDCDDNDPTRYPGAPDARGDGIDQNCDGVDGPRDPASGAVDPAAPPLSPSATDPAPTTPVATPPAE